MRDSSQKDLSVYDFKADDVSVEAATSKYVKKSSVSSLNPKDGQLTKYHFLQAFTSGHKQVDATDTSCIDLRENGSSEGSFAIASPDMNVSSEEKSDSDEIMSSSKSYDEKDNLYHGEVDHAPLVRVGPLVTAASGLLVPTVGNEHVLGLQSYGPPLDMISDDGESYTSLNQSPTTSATVVEDEDQWDFPASDNCCSTYEEKDNDDMQVVVSPDYVICGETLYEEAFLMFSPDNFKVECSDACSQSEKFILERPIADIICIGCQWSGSIEGALVKFRMRTAIEKRNEVQDTHDVGQLIFAVNGMQWLEKEQKIKSLATRYEDAWNILESDDLILEDGTRRHNKFFPNHYFLEIPHSFEDVIYPKGDPDAVSISRRDIEQLQPDTFLNDTIIDFYIKYLKGQILPHEKHRFHFFNSFFFRKLADLDKDPGSASEGRAAFLRVRKWTRKVDIFEKDYIFIPVNFNLHWSLLVICHPGEAATSEEDNVANSCKVPCILHMDSIKGSHSGLKNLLQSYIWEEWKERHPEAAEEHSSKFLNLRFVPLEVPQQENSFDCGLFLLHFVELFLEEAPLNFNPLKVTKFSKFLSMDWFSPSEASFKRYVIRKLIYELLSDPSQKVTSSTFGNEDLSLRDCQNVLEQEPAVQFVSEQCNKSKTVLDNSVCFVTDGGNRTNHVTTSTVGASFCNKQEDLLLQPSLETKATSMSSPKHQDNAFEENAPPQLLKRPTCPGEAPVRESEQYVSSSPEKNGSRLFGECRTAQETCLTSYYPKEDGMHKMTGTCIQEKEIGANLMLRTLISDNPISNEKGEIENSGFVSVDERGHVPDSNTASSGENKESGSPEIGTSKTEDSGNRVNSNIKKDTTEATTANDDCQEINTTEAKVDHAEDSQEISSSKAEEVVRAEGFEDTNVDESDGDGEYQEITTGADGDGEYQEITTGATVCGSEGSKEIGIGKGENDQSFRISEGTNDATTEIESSKCEDQNGNGGDSQKAEQSAAGEASVDNPEGCQAVGPSTVEVVDVEDHKLANTAEVEVGDGENSQQICYDTVKDTGDSCEESLQLPLCHGIVIADNEPSKKVSVQLKREKPATASVVPHQKRRKVLHTGVRMHTRSRTRDSLS